MNNLQLNGRESTTAVGAGAWARETSDAAHEGQNVLTLGDLLKTVWRRLWMIILITGVLAGLALGFSYLQTPMYETSIKLLINQDRAEGTIPNNLQSEVQGLERVNKTMVEAVSTRPVVETVIQKLDLQASPGTVQGNLRAKEIPDTQFVQVWYKDPSPERAQLVANTVGDTFSEQVSEVAPEGFAITVTNWERAALPGSPVSPDPVRNLLLALALGLMIGVGVAFLLEYLDDRVRSPEQVEQVSGVPSLGAIPAPEGGKDVKVWRRAEKKENPN